MSNGFAIATGQTPRWRKKAVSYGIFVLWCLGFAYWSDYNWPTGTGNLCLVLFLAANVYIPAKQLRKRFRFRGVQPYFNLLLKAHCYLNTASFVVACWHCYTTNWTNFWLWISLILMGVLTLNGFVMRLKYPPRFKKGIYLLHSQQFVFFALFYTMLKGHYVFQWLPP